MRTGSRSAFSEALGDDRAGEQLRQELHALLAERAVKHGTFTLTSGATSDFYVDCRVVTTLPDGMHSVGWLMLEQIAEAAPEAKAVGGLSIGADPIAASVSMASYGTGLQMPMFMVRKEPKGHGMGKQVEGAFPDGEGVPVVVVDDVLTTGGSVLQAIAAVEREKKAKVALIIVIVDRNEGGRERLEEMGYTVRSLFTRREDFPK